MNNSPGGHASMPLRLVVLTETCADCPRRFTVEGYDNDTVRQANTLLSRLRDEHRRTEHPDTR